MKKMFFFAAMAALALVGCNDKTQSELDENVLNGTGQATIKATFYYNPGPQEVGGAVVEGLAYIPDSVQVYAKVDYAVYADEKPQPKNAYKMIPLASKGNGVFEGTIPVGAKQVTVDVVANGFYATFKESVESKPIRAFFPTLELTGLTVLNGQEVVLDKDDATNPTIYGAAIKPLDNEATVEMVISGNISGDVEELEQDDEKCKKNCTYTLKSVKEEKSFAGKDVDVVVEYLATTEKDGEKVKVDDRVLTYSIKTEANGAYNATVKFFESWTEYDQIQITVIPKAFQDDDFVHNYKELDVAATESKYYNDNTVDADDDYTRTDAVYDWVSEKVPGYWKYKPVAKEKGLVFKLDEGLIKYAKKTTGRDVTMVFYPFQKIADIPGVTAGEDVDMDLVNSKADKNNTTTVTKKQYQVNDVLSWASL